MVSNRSMRGDNLSTVNDEKIGEKSLEILKDIFENTNRWLNFAEAKNGALIGVNGLFLFKSVDYLFEILNGKLKVDILVVGLMTTVFFIAILIALKSFFPNTGVYKDRSDISDADTSNADRILIFYEDICKYQSSKLYLRDIYKYYMEVNVEIEDLKKMELDYAKEILINSRITSYKYKLFRNAMKLNFIGIFIFIIFLIIA